MSSPRYVILTDFGSTFTKVVVADLSERKMVLTDRFPSTVSYDARIGLEQCFDAARKAIGEEAFARALKLSSSSAAGGLRMGVVGLSKTLSAQAGRSAAFGAGAKILHTCAGRLKVEDISCLEELPLEILLFCGGYENSGTKVLLHNAELLAGSGLHIPIIYAGNSAAASEVRRLLTQGKKECYLARNIIPNVGQIDKSQVEEIIREVFLHRIINMKGLDKVSGLLDRMVMPTPAAVLSAGELLARGTPTQPGFGDLMIVDVGGATTDIHSYAQQMPYEGAKVVGTPEPYGKRTVEGDLGMRESSNSLCDEIGLDRMIRETGLSSEEIQSVISHWITQNRDLAREESQKKVDKALAEGAVRISACRHAGQIQRVSSAGVKTLQHGKNLTSVGTVIGTGGALVFSGHGATALGQVLRNSEREPDILLPEEADCYLDADYVFFAGGLLREIDEEAAFAIMKNSLKKV
ncbi:MAG: glutamate mutase L [Ruminiclostridium sp.]|nr:glutamate mutase L [Ruminiclostridium sp.]